MYPVIVYGNEYFPSIQENHPVITGNRLLGREDAIVNNPYKLENVMMEEIIVPKKGIFGKVKLCFNSVESKIAGVYIKYHKSGKRKLL
jgi:hypothetical protein